MTEPPNRGWAPNNSYSECTAHSLRSTPHYKYWLCHPLLPEHPWIIIVTGSPSVHYYSEWATLSWPSTPHYYSEWATHFWLSAPHYYSEWATHSWLSTLHYYSGWATHSWLSTPHNYRDWAIHSLLSSPHYYRYWATHSWLITLQNKWWLGCLTEPLTVQAMSLKHKYNLTYYVLF